MNSETTLSGTPTSLTILSGLILTSDGNIDLLNHQRSFTSFLDVTIRTSAAPFLRQISRTTPDLRSKDCLSPSSSRDKPALLSALKSNLSLSLVHLTDV